MKERISAELDRLESNRVLSKVERSDWATPTMNLLKKDQGVRICGDYKVTINPMIDLDRYPLPTAENIFATLAGGKQFTKLDLAHAYNQLQLEESSKEYLTISTHHAGPVPTRPPQLWGELGTCDLPTGDVPDLGWPRRSPVLFG